MSDAAKLLADLKQMQAGANQIKAAGQQAMQQAAPGGKGFSVGLRLHKTPKPLHNPASVVRRGQTAMLAEFNRQAK